MGKDSWNVFWRIQGGFGRSFILGKWRRFWGGKGEGKILQRRSKEKVENITYKLYTFIKEGRILNNRVLRTMKTRNVLHMLEK